MNKDTPFELPITVRGYELDAFQHVNNAVYVQYFEHTRWMAFQRFGPEWLSTKGLSIVVRKLTVEYEAPATVFDRLLARLWIERVGNTSLTFGQDLLRESDGHTMARAEIVAVCLGPDQRPHPVPKEWLDAAGWPGASTTSTSATIDRQTKE